MAIAGPGAIVKVPANGAESGFFAGRIGNYFLSRVFTREVTNGEGIR